MKYLIIISVLFLTGCGTSCKSHCFMGIGPGAPVYEMMANHYDSRDPCQSREFGDNGTRLKPAGYSSKDYPEFCGASRGKTYTVTKGIGNNTYIVNKQ